MDEFGDLLMIIGSILFIIGFGGLCILGIWQAFQISLPLGLTALAFAGFGFGMIGTSISS